MPTPSRSLKFFVVFLSILTANFAWSADSGGDGIGDELRQELYLPPGRLDFVTIATSKDQHDTEKTAAQNAPDILKLEACHVGQQRLLFRITFARKPVFEGAGIILYTDLDTNRQTGRQDSATHRGVDLMATLSGSRLEVTRHNPAFTKGNSYVAAAKIVGCCLYVVLDAPLAVAEGKVRFEAYLLCQRKGGRSDSTPRLLAELPWLADRKVPTVSAKGVSDLRSLSDYRYHNDRVKLESLADKGLTYEKIRPAKPIEPGRPRPLPPFSTTSRKPGKAGSVAIERVPVQLLEEAGVARSGACLSFGLPLPQGALFELDNLRLLSSAGREIAAQFTATSFWPDDSLKWVLIDTALPLAARQSMDCRVEFGSRVHRGTQASPLKAESVGETITVVTGPLKVEIDKRRFRLFSAVWLDANHDGRFTDDEGAAASGPEGAVLVDQNGERFTMSNRPPESVRIEEQGPQKVVLRVEGPYAADDGRTYMRYIARLIFRAGSPRVELVFTHVNDYLQTEFTDITSLGIPMKLSGGLQRAAVSLAGDDAKRSTHQGRAVAVVQLDERTCSLRADGKTSQGRQASGAASCVGPRGAATVAFHDFWQRWPKALSADAQGLQIDLLPKQPDKDFGKGLPHYLLYPFVEGFYRFKWGMAFTERVSFDFSGKIGPEELLAEANSAVVAVLPAAWYAKSNALGPMAVPQGGQFGLWDKYLADCYQNYLRVRDKDRTYGYFNYGDWYGERGRNWGNNEYDLAHGYFMQFVRSGNRDYFRLALVAARHQADVDCVHAYPDPHYVGANHQHSIGHTGTWSQNPRHATWSHRYDSHTSAENGHTWAEGMLDAWFLAGESPVMESALALSEHLTWATSPNFKALGTHERSAGWSLKAIMAAYRATYDPLYLDAARRIAAVALAEQKFDDGGAWPHVLPQDHAGGHPGARGNAVFLISILLAGLQDYHLQTHDPAVAKSIVSGARWLVKCWNEEAQGWPYTASPAGEPYFKPSTGLSLMPIGPLAYAGHLTGESRFMEIVEAALGATLRSGAGSDGKAIAQKMIFASGALALLQGWYAEHHKDQQATLLSTEFRP